ncbi:MAG: glycosyltransferase family A protein, partial [Rhodobacteraceae bacterium]|nr:glycosyltransferase family A protein [Paracoccaceae bacterium]
MISVIVPHFNQPDYLDRCLASLLPQASGAEIIVVDNGSTVRPEPVVARYPGVILLEERTQGPGPARSHGARSAKGDLLAFIDADCVADPGWLAAIGRAFADPA